MEKKFFQREKKVFIILSLKGWEKKWLYAYKSIQDRVLRQKPVRATSEKKGRKRKRKTIALVKRYGICAAYCIHLIWKWWLGNVDNSVNESVKKKNIYIILS